MTDNPELGPLSFQLYRIEGVGADEKFIALTGATYNCRFRF
jgi:hypothetical protein